MAKLGKAEKVVFQRESKAIVWKWLICEERQEMQESLFVLGSQKKWKDFRDALKAAWYSTARHFFLLVGW